MECQSMSFVKNHIPYLWDLSNSFSNSFIDFYSCEGFIKRYIRKNEAEKLRVENGGWHETLNLLHVSGCEMLHFVTSYMNQNKSRKQTLESAQYGLKISFKISICSTPYGTVRACSFIKTIRLLTWAQLHIYSTSFVKIPFHYWSL